MPTIDDLAPASSASDSDEFIVSQSGIVRKITRAQVLNGVQSQLAVPSGSLLGNSGSGIGTPEVITVGRNLNFIGSTLSAAAAPFIINNLPIGTVPSSGDLVSMSQAGTAVAVTYGQLMNGIAGISNINLTQALVTPAGATTVQTLGQLTAAMLPLSGGTLTGGLTLSGTPTASTQAASKGYVDQQVAAALPLVGGSLSGMLTLCGTPQYPLQAATKDYADSIGASALSSAGGSLSGTLLLNADPTTPLQAATKQYVDGQLMARLPYSGGTLTGPLTLVGAPTTPLQAATKSYVDANPSSEGVINVKLSPYNAKIDGVTDDTAAFKSAYQNATAGATIYVPSGTTVLQQPGAWGIALTKRVRWIVAGTVLADGTPLAAAIPTGGGPSTLTLPGFVVGNTLSGLTTSQGSSQSTDFAVNQSSYIVNHSGGTNGTVISNARVDTIIYSSPGDYIWGGLDRLIWAGTQTPSAADPGATRWTLHPDGPASNDYRIEWVLSAAAAALGCLHRI